MRLSRILLFIGALTLPVLPVAAQGKAGGKPAGVGKPAAAIAKAPKAQKPADTAIHGKSADHAKSGDHTKAATDTTTHGKSGDHAKNDDHGKNTVATTGATPTEDTNGRGQLPLTEKIRQNATLKARLDALLAGGALSFEDATSGWKNQGQLVAAMNAARNNELSFSAIRTEMVTNGKNLDDAVAAVKKSSSTTTTSTTTTTTATTTKP